MVTGEDVRVLCAEVEIAPHHHNAWGAAINTMVRRGLLVPTGMFTQMKDVRSHARLTRVYRVGEIQR